MRNKNLKLFLIFLFLSCTSIYSNYKIFDIHDHGVGKDFKLFTSSFNETHVQEWNFTWGGYYHEDSRTINYDSSGNVYIAGRTNYTVTGNVDVFLAKFNSLGEFQWNQTFRGDGEDIAYDMVIDSLDNIYLVVNTEDDLYYSSLLLVKYNYLGQLQWNQTWGGSYDDHWYGIALDSKENIYVVGGTANFTNNRKICLVKFNTSGHYQWNCTWGGNNYDDLSYDVIIDSSDNIYITGFYQKEADEYDLCLLKYNNSGHYQWNRTFDSGRLDFGFKLGLDSSDDIYISGITDNTSITDNRMLLLKYNNSGNLLWNQIWGERGFNLFYGLQLDTEDNIYLAGTVNYSAVKNQEFCLIQFNISGSEKSMLKWGGSKVDGYTAMTIDSSDNIYLTGIRNDDEIYLEKYYKIDNAPPYIWINSPKEGEIFEHEAPTFNLTVIDPNLDLLWYTINDTFTEVFTAIISGINLITVNQSLWDNLPYGHINVSFFANDTANNINFEEVTIIKKSSSTERPSNNIISFGNGYMIFFIFIILYLIIVYFKRRRILS